MIKASYLQQQATKYRKLARGEESLEMRRQLFALAARCDELAVSMERAPARKTVAKLTMVKKTETGASPSAAPNGTVAPAVAAPALPFSGHSRARLVHRFAD
jgi:hypothetical protein